ncbi:MAG TPA: alpha-amylase family glycosyl hydrolase [Bacteroidia bacterium]|nr:alpha-amylase family glycosyl hydrolase [Bacteroidia bacterium]
MEIKSRYLLFILFWCGMFNITVMAQEENIENGIKPRPDVKYINQPLWSINSNIYEVNLRQYAKNSNFKSFEKEIPRLKSMGIDILWFMPIFPIGVKDRKGTLGSYYAVKDYRSVNEEFGSLEDFKHLVNYAHSLGMHVIIDWVANHTAPDHKWTETNPDFYTKNAEGKFVAPTTEWNDVIDLNYDNKTMRSTMIDAMKYWLTETKIDGFRCDKVDLVPLDFWIEMHEALVAVNPNIFMLAEGDKPEFHAAFNMTYTWKAFEIFKKVAKGEYPARVIDDILGEDKYYFSPKGVRMYYTSNDEENSLNGSDKQIFGDAAKPFYVLSATLYGMPLLYSGQEAGLDKKLKMYDKDPIVWGSYANADFYTRLLSLKRRNNALLHSESGGAFAKILNNKPDQVYSFYRRKGKDELVVILNLSNKDANVRFERYLFAPNYTELFTDKKGTIKIEDEMILKPWEYRVYVKD